MTHERDFITALHALDRAADALYEVAAVASPRAAARLHAQYERDRARVLAEWSKLLAEVSK